ncbi:unnamed protein product [Rhizoctonia solani]|uniref:Uncharacterized protein n=1 Tax=Rhizoctonia solani TaxID=456999 RepID=A0A8H2Y332_9AGAM|nr:unnamed protein product [Rhizoctonia solani]
MGPQYSGLCAGYTKARANLSDAIALVHGDWCFTIDLTPANLGSCGWGDVQRDTKNHSFVSYLPKTIVPLLVEL